MKIKKLSEITTYSQKNITTTFSVNGKEVKVYDWYVNGDNVDYDFEQTFDKEDLEALTELEAEMFCEDLNEWLEMKDGEEQEVEDYDPNESLKCTHEGCDELQGSDCEFCPKHYPVKID